MADCDGEHIGSVCAGESSTNADVGKPKRAKQTIPPATRRLVLRRDRHRCVFPGCRHATFVDVHHIRSKADGGGHEAENLITLCCAHHRALHRGDVAVDGRAPSALHFSHSDGTAYGENVSPLAADTRACAFRALRGMGFGEVEVRKAISQAAKGARDSEARPPLESVLRNALVELTNRHVTRAA